jgi:hypothetical protein
VLRLKELVKMDDQTIDYKKKMTGKNNGIQLKSSLVCGVIVSCAGLGKLMREMMAKMKSEAERRVTLETEVEELKAQLAEKEEENNLALANYKQNSNKIMSEMVSKVGNVVLLEGLCNRILSDKS